MRLFATIAISFLISAAAFAADPAPPAASTSTSLSTDDTSNGTSEYKVKMDVTESRLIFGLYGQMSQFERAGVQLVGYNLEGLADYAITDQAAVQISINQSLDMADGISVLFTGIRLGGAYAFWGDFIHRNSVLRINNQETLAVRTPDSTLLATDIGIEQYLFNGTDRIVPATGISVGGRYDRTLYGMRASLMLRYGSLVISATPVSMITAGLGVMMRF